MQLERDGFCMVPHVLAESALAPLLRLSSSVHAVTQRGGIAFAARGLLQQAPGLRAELGRSGLDALASESLGAPAFAVDTTFFDKPAGANWAVPAHQDRVFPVDERSWGAGVRRRGDAALADLDAQTLQGLVALRLHFDAADESNGALTVLPGSHRAGVLTAADIAAQPLSSFRLCGARAGEIMSMRPLLLHRSARSLGGRRRVLHVVYATRHPNANVRFRTG